MKKLILTGTVAACMSFIVGCGNSTSSTTSADSTNKTSADTTAAMSSSTKDTSSSTTSTVDQTSSDFAMKAAKGGMAEVAVGKVAEQKATSKRVKDFAMMMVTDHTKANDDLKQRATALNITLPAGVADDDQKMIDKLSAKSGADFDKAYMDMMLDDHKKTIDLFKTEAASGTNASLKDFATSTLPTLQKHLAEVQTITNKK